MSEYPLFFAARPDERFAPNPSIWKQIQAFGKQIFGSQVNYFMDAYKKATAPRFGYLFDDVHPQGSVYKLRTHILEHQMITVFLPENRKP